MKIKLADEMLILIQLKSSYIYATSINIKIFKIQRKEN